MKTIIFDGNNAIWRLAMKMPLLSTSSGQMVQIVYGFLKLIRSALFNFSPSRAIVCWDLGLPEFRLSVWPDYKKDRIAKKLHPDPERKRIQGTIGRQTRIIKDILPGLCVRQLEIQGLEGDDLIALACKYLNGRKIIVANDRDMLQLVSVETSVYSPISGEMFNWKNFKKKLGVSPQQYLQVRALSGDSGDGIPGICKGFGEKTATQLISKYGSLYKLYEDERVISKVKKMGKRYALIYGNGCRQTAARNFSLMDLIDLESKTAAKMIREVVNSKCQIDKAGVKGYFEKHEFASLLDRFAGWVVPFSSLSFESYK